MGRQIKRKPQKLWRDRALICIGGALVFGFSALQIQSVFKHRLVYPLWVLRISQAVEKITGETSFDEGLHSAIEEVSKVSEEQNLQLTKILVQNLKVIQVRTLDLDLSQEQILTQEQEQILARDLDLEEFWDWESALAKMQEQEEELTVIHIREELLTRNLYQALERKEMPELELVLARNMKLSRSLELSQALALARDLNLVLVQYLAFVQDMQIQQAQELVQHLKFIHRLNLDLARHLTLAQELELGLEKALNLEQALEHDMVFVHDLAQHLEMDHLMNSDLFHDLVHSQMLNRTLARTLDRAQILEQANNSLLAFIIATELERTHGLTLQKGNTLETLLSHEPNRARTLMQSRVLLGGSTLVLLVLLVMLIRLQGPNNSSRTENLMVLLPKEYLADLRHLESRLQKQNTSPEKIQTRLIQEIIWMLWARYVRIPIDNFFLGDNQDDTIDD